MGKAQIIAERQRLGQSFVYKDLRRDQESYGKRYANTRLIDSNWKEIKLPGELEKVYGEVDGAFWFRKTISIPKEWAGKDLKLDLGPVDDGDLTYFNGTEIGSIHADVPGSYDMPRCYTVPADLVKAGKAVIAIRCFDSAHAGGFWGPAMTLRLNDTELIDLTGIWKTRAEEILDPLPWPGEYLPLVKIYRVGSVLYNAMLYPIRRYPVRNVIWYQGESNADGIAVYETLFQDLIRNWRETLGQAELPFYFVQLAAYQKPVRTPSAKNNWAICRAAQEKALELPATGMVTAIDIGDAVRIHPLKKREVGERLAGMALQRIYGIKGAEMIYPVAETQVEIKNQNLLVKVKTSGSPLLMPAGGKINCMALQNKEGAWQWASEKSRIVPVDVSAGIWGIEIPCEKPENIIKIRYAWEINPEVNVFDENGAPLLPFERSVIHETAENAGK